MKNLLLALVVANILYFMWGMFTDEPLEPGVAVVTPILAALRPVNNPARVGEHNWQA